MFECVKLKPNIWCCFSRIFQTMNSVRVSLTVIQTVQGPACWSGSLSDTGMCGTTLHNNWFMDSCTPWSHWEAIVSAQDSWSQTSVNHISAGGKQFRLSQRFFLLTLKYMYTHQKHVWVIWLSLHLYVWSELTVYRHFLFILPSHFLLVLTFDPFHSWRHMTACLFFYIRTSYYSSAVSPCCIYLACLICC